MNMMMIQDQNVAYFWSWFDPLAGYPKNVPLSDLMQVKHDCIYTVCFIFSDPSFLIHRLV